MPRRVSGRRHGDLAKVKLGDLARQGERDVRRHMAAANLRRREAALARAKAAEEDYPAEWQKFPGEPGFTAYATKIMRRAGVLADGKDQVKCVDRSKPTYDQPYQRVVSFLVHPKSTPDYRLLVAHRTGAGKTLTMIRVLSNFYDDPRPKVAIFPSATVRDQFYRELLAFDNPYRDYVLAETGIDGDRARRRELAPAEFDAGVKALALHGALLRRAGTEGYPAAPLRAFSYNEIGGSAIKQMRWFQPTGPCGAAGGKPNLFCDKVIVMDEAHNLIKPDETKFKLAVSRENLANARDALARARRTVMVLLTATPMVDDVADVDALLRVVKGHGNEHLSDEGFVSAFYGAPTTAYPSVTPSERELPRVVRVELDGDPDDKTTALGSYLDKMLTRDGKVKREWSKASSRDLYDYVATHPSFQTRAPFPTQLKTSKAEVMAPKLWRAGQFIAEADGKVVVLTARRHGFFALATLLRTNPAFRDLAVQALIGTGITTTRADWKATVAARGGQSERDIMLRFNAADNVDGSKLKALVLNADVFSEGVDFKDVRYVLLLDVSPKWATVLQRVGRAVRHCSSIRLPKSRRTVETVLMVASLPAYARRKKGVVDLRDVLTADEENVVKVLRDRAEIEAKMCELMAKAVDAPIMGDAAVASGCGAAVRRRRKSGSKAIKLSQGQTNRLLACHRKHGNCLVKAQRDFGLEASANGDMWASTESMRTTGSASSPKKSAADQLEAALKLCDAERDACIAKIMGPGNDHNFGDNCPPGYGFGQCVYHCRHERRLSGRKLGRCIVRQNPVDAASASASTSSSPAKKRKSGTQPPSSGCPVCPAGMPDAQCLSYCKEAGLKHGDLYRCASRTAEAPACEHAAGDPPRVPSPPKPPPGKVRNPLTGKLIKRDGPLHKKLCRQGTPGLDGCLGAVGAQVLQEAAQVVAAAAVAASAPAAPPPRKSSTPRPPRPAVAASSSSTPVIAGRRSLKARRRISTTTPSSTPRRRRGSGARRIILPSE